MKREEGLWIDRRKTAIVMVSGETEETPEMASNMDKRSEFLFWHKRSQEKISATGDLRIVSEDTTTR